MLLTVRTTHRPASELGYVLHKNPARVQSFDLSFGRAVVFNPDITRRQTDTPQVRSHRRRNGEQNENQKAEFAVHGGSYLQIERRGMKHLFKLQLARRQPLLIGKLSDRFKNVPVGF